MTSKAEVTTHSVRIQPELWNWFKKHHPRRGDFAYFVNQVLVELKETQGHRMTSQEAAKAVARKLRRKF